jgi:hypothetical protein
MEPLLFSPAYALLCDTLEEALEELKGYYCSDKRIHDLQLDSEAPIAALRQDAIAPTVLHPLAGRSNK